ncbi:MAG: PRC-barrel domain-containing protein [Roseinatronobacter sp.]
MLKKFLATTAVGAFVAMPVLAQVAPGEPVPNTDMPSMDAAPMDDTHGGDIPAVNEQVGGADMLDTTVASGTFLASNLKGADLIGADGETIAAVDDIVVSPNGQVDSFLVDVGGFLGLGARTIAIAFSDVTIGHDENENVELRTTLTQEQLEAMPEYEDFS